MIKCTTAAFATALLIPTAFATAQLPLGMDAPAFEIRNAFNGAPPSFAELKGRLVLLEFFATW
ncbi:MAG: hypothetical protein IPM29_16190 [Planctomycetes bacterium]|nr:hypothetical protein [Planctomycetota bacterium]